MADARLIDPRAPSPAPDDFSRATLSTLTRHLNDDDSLARAGGDTTRDLYTLRRPSVRRTVSDDGVALTRLRLLLVSMPLAADIRAPGGFRRQFVYAQTHQANFTRNFVEFLALYGHFAGEDLEELDDESSDTTPLLEPSVPQIPLVYRRVELALTTKTLLLLLKAFIGTGVLFLPRGFANAGWAVASGLLVFFSIVSFYCFLLLIDTKHVTGVTSYGGVGNALYGRAMRNAILTAIVFSQLGFSAAYIVFVLETLGNVLSPLVCVRDLLVCSGGSLSSTLLILVQVLILYPLALTRNIAKLSGPVLVLNAFIFIGIVYVFVYASGHIVAHGVASGVAVARPQWLIFVGTAVFSYEGIGLLLPIEATMKHPRQFTPALTVTMAIVTTVFVTIGGLCYAAFGASTETVVWRNLPLSSPAGALVQVLYATAIILSAPLQLFPAIRILETALFGKLLGKRLAGVKWAKNAFRALVVALTMALATAGAGDLDHFVLLVGSLACIPLIYIFPPLLYTRARGPAPAPLAILALGALMMVYTMWENVRSW